MIDDFDPSKAERHVRELANAAPVFTLSVRRPESLDAWFDWVRDSIQSLREGQPLNPKIQPEGAAVHTGS
jgi:hydrogenase nickel incorporation protein HypB